MAHAPVVGSLVLTHEARCGGAALPMSLALHAAGVFAVLWIPGQLRPDLSPVPAIVRDVLVLRVAPAAGPPPVVATRPTRAPSMATTRTPEMSVPAQAPGRIPIPVVEPSTLPPADDDTKECVGCIIGGETSKGPFGDGGGDDDSSDGDVGPGGPGRAAEPLRVGGLVTAPAKLRNVDPVYPPIARQAGVQGTVVIECVIDTAGRVVQSRVVQSVRLLDEAALAAVKEWVYRPSRLNGTPVSVVMRVSVQFRLR